MSHGRRESWRKILLTDGKLTKAYGRYCSRTECLQKMTESPSAARRVNRSWRKFPQMHGKLSEVKRKVQFSHKMFSTDRQNVDGSWQKVLWTNGELTKCLADGHKVDECWGKSCCRMDIWWMFPRTHRKLPKVYGSSRGRTASGQRLKEEPADVRKLDR